jgi:hypothetical protein
VVYLRRRYRRKDGKRHAYWALVESCRVEISAAGFSKYVVEGVIVRVTETTAFTATLKVGAITESVTVTGVATAVNLTSAATGEVIGKINKASISRSLPGTFQDDQYVISVDKQITSKDKLTGRWFFSDNSIVQPFGGAATLPFARGVPGFNRFLKVGWNHVFSPSVVNDVRVGLNRFHFVLVPTEPIALTDIGETRGNSAEFPAASEFMVNGGGSFSLGTGVNDDRGGTFNTFVYGDDFSITWGKHLFRLGGEISQYQLNRFNRFATRGSVTFSDIGGLAALQDFLLGRVTTTQVGAGFFTFHFRAVDGAWYFQDDWKISKRLTLNLGLRHELLSTAHEKDNFLSNFAGLQDGSTDPHHPPCFHREGRHVRGYQLHPCALPGPQGLRSEARLCVGRPRQSEMDVARRRRVVLSARLQPTAAADFGRLALQPGHQRGAILGDPREPVPEHPADLGLPAFAGSGHSSAHLVQWHDWRTHLPKCRRSSAIGILLLPGPRLSCSLYRTVEPDFAARVRQELGVGGRSATWARMA